MNSDMSKKQAQFFAGLILICTITAALVLVIDYQIKGAILEQANRLRLEIEDWQRGQGTKTTGSNRPDNHAGNDVSYPADLVHSGTTGVEANGHSSPGNREGKATHVRTARPSRANGASSIPGTDQQSES